MVAQALYLINYKMVQRVACLYQNDTFGIGGFNALVTALANVGIELVASGTYTKGTTNVAAAVEAIAGASQKAQVVVMVALQDAITQFINLFHNDSRVDSECFYTIISDGWGTSFALQLPVKFWSSLYFFFAVPLPNDPSYIISQNFEKSYAAAGYESGPIAFEGYLVGRMVIEGLKATHNSNPTSAMFLDSVYNGRLFVLDDLVLGLYSTNWTGCSVALCSCNTGLREVHLAQLDPATGDLGKPIKNLRYSILDCSNPISSVIAPLLFGQLLPSYDDGWYAVSVDIGRGLQQAFQEANLNGGANGRNFTLLQQNYSANTLSAVEQFFYRYPLMALLGSVVPDTQQLSGLVSMPTIGDLDMQPDGADSTFNKSNIGLQPSTALELMGLAQFAVTQGCSIHLRAPNSNSGSELLSVMVQSVNSFQVVPQSASLYDTSADVLSSIQSGCVIALGSDADVLSWYKLLPSYPNLHLLILSASAMRLMAVLPTASSLAQAPQLHFPTIVTAIWNTTVNTSHNEAWTYGYLAGVAATQAILHSQYADDSYTTASQLVEAWYSVSVMTSGSLTFGPYYGSTCRTGETDCECNQGTRSVGVRTAASAAVEMVYSSATCHVVYTPLRTDSTVMIGSVVGSVVGAFVVLVIVVLVLFFRYGKRNNVAAPKNSNKPFCVLFTDIQSSTHLWASIPDIMAPALDTHHALIRKLIAKYKCYEVKTIGDSFMCAAHTPQQAVEMALAIQLVFYEYNWGSEAINDVYREGVPDGDDGRISRSYWNGLRVRVGIHYGQGEVKFDEVSKGYDYYGTVVNTAARIESACHGGQIGVSRAVYDALGGSLPGSVWTDLGPHELRGLSEPIRLYQILPVGPYSKRTFPPLRVEKEDQIHEALEAAVEEITIVAREASGGGQTSAQRTSLSSATGENWKWLDTNPLVLRGDISAEDLKKHYVIALTTLTTLLNTQTNKFKEAVLQGLCDRLHVTNFGVQGAQLQRTLKGLVHRVLPATVMNTQCELVSRQMSGVSGSIPVVDINTLNSFRGSPKEPRNKVIPVVQDAEDS
eukprot:GGOE01032466.1.p1 GENE.GGOE01032466.1~~GGOE01032466.1.p1  ORF type:complete len:1206 (-),score=349.63 GGOE01032466.1:1260-4403(-)